MKHHDALSVDLVFVYTLTVPKNIEFIFEIGFSVCLLTIGRAFTRSRYKRSAIQDNLGWMVNASFNIIHATTSCQSSLVCSTVGSCAGCSSLTLILKCVSLMCLFGGYQSQFHAGASYLL